MRCKKNIKFINFISIEVCRFYSFMKYLQNYNSHLFFGVLTTLTVGVNTCLVALSSSAYVLELYLRLRNEDGPLGTDPVILRTRKKERICKDIGRSGFFQLVGLYPADETDTDSDGSRDECYNSTERENPYELRDFNVLDSVGSHDFKEYVFTCASLEDFFIYNRPAVLYHVSKEYNVSPVEELHKPGRFVLANLTPEVQSSYNYMILAEEAAVAYTTPGFNVELHYIQMRKYISPVKNEDDDPLCKMISVTVDDPRDQYRRLCAAVSKSSSFKTEITYPDLYTQPCSTQNISFKTEEAMKEAAIKSYREQMILCWSSTSYSYDSSDDEDEDDAELLLISRAYLTNAVFVYRRDPTDGKIYLENLSTNISIVDELNSFDFIEY